MAGSAARQTVRKAALVNCPRMMLALPLNSFERMSSVAKGKSQEPLSFETALAELETIVASLEGGQLPLEQSLIAYKRGAELLQFCQQRLQEAQQQVKILEADTLQDLKSGED
jgi:exodeoxyribonuclease VII small subunit